LKKEKEEITYLLNMKHMYRWKLIGALLALLGCGTSNPAEQTAQEPAVQIEEVPLPEYIMFFQHHPRYLSDGFDFPVGPPDAKGYYDAQPFGQNTHLGDDWNAVTGGNSDLGDTIYAIANGWVSASYDARGGWGNVMRIIHALQGDSIRFVESLYAHCDTLLLEKGDSIRRGMPIATIGNANELYWAHLHLELRDSAGMPLGGGYGVDQMGYLSPTDFIRRHRP